MLYLTSRAVVAPLVKAIWRPTIEGRENVPATGGVILASNHLSFIDSVVIPLAAPRQVHFLAKESYFTGTGVKGAASRVFFTSMGMVPVNRDDSRAAIKSLEVGLKILQDGHAFGIYPEGTRSRDGRLYRGHTGVAYLALTAQVPIVPVGVIGTPDVQPVGSNRPRRAPFTVRFGTPQTPHTTYADLPAGKARRLATDDVMDAIAALTGQERTTEYNEHPIET